MSNKLEVSSEIDQLRKVITHRPESGISRISPKRSDELLFDDIVDLPLMQKEHDVFTDVLKAFVGEEGVLETEQLLAEALQLAGKGKKEFLDMIIQFEELPPSWYSKLGNLDNKTLAKVLISGYLEADDHILFDPIPNFIFTRDIAVMVKDYIIIAKANKEARHRENLLARFFIYYHPVFSSVKAAGKIINLNHIEEFPPSKYGEVASVEGGDMMILFEDYFLIGVSERSTLHGFNLLKNALLQKGVVKYVVQVNMPNDRSFMHLDTIFTQINKSDFVGYKPIVSNGMSSNIVVYGQSGTTRNYSSLHEFLKNEINPDISIIHAGLGLSPYQEREQWTDGCNLVVLKAGVGVTYDRNPKTAIAFENAGYNIIKAYDFLEGVKNGSIDVDELEKTIITLPSTELSRARGGSHCMTCPILRE